MYSLSILPVNIKRKERERRKINYMEISKNKKATKKKLQDYFKVYSVTRVMDRKDILT